VYVVWQAGILLPVSYIYPKILAESIANLLP
jgi:hypothetical protein